MHVYGILYSARMYVYISKCISRRFDEDEEKRKAGAKLYINETK